MMTAEKKIRSLIVGIVFLVVTNSVLLLFLLFSKNNNPHPPGRDTRSIIEVFLEDKIGFDEKQMALYKNMREADFEMRAPIFDTLQSAKNAFYESIYADSAPDPVIVNLAVALSAKQTAVDMHMLRYFKNVRRICTAAQLPAFDSSFKVVVQKVTAVKYKSKKKVNH